MALTLVQDVGPPFAMLAQHQTITWLPLVCAGFTSVIFLHTRGMCGPSARQPRVHIAKPCEFHTIPFIWRSRGNDV